jgi:hypothetical protein
MKSQKVPAPGTFGNPSLCLSKDQQNYSKADNDSEQTEEQYISYVVPRRSLTGLLRLRDDLAVIAASFAEYFHSLFNVSEV